MSEAGRRVGKEQRIDVPKTARYLTLGPTDATDLWIVLHGYGQLAGRFLRRFAPIDVETHRGSRGAVALLRGERPRTTRAGVGRRSHLDDA